MIDNPLQSTQREKFGAKTFEKYEYQYHWALCRIIDEQKKKNEYVLFMEYHEDVVLANSLSQETAEFEFYQVKNIQTPKFNVQNLTKISSGKKNSILGKMLCSVNDKPFRSKVLTISFVASCGFNFDLNDNGLNLEIITLSDLSEKSILDLTNALQKEISISSLPDCLRFIIPDLNISNQQDTVIGRISLLISEAFPDSHYEPTNIYRILIDELHRKGVVAYDYNKWDDLLTKKAITSQKVTQAINAYVTPKDLKVIKEDVSQIANDLQMPYIAKKQMVKDIENIHLKAIGFPSSLSLKIRNSIDSAIDSLGRYDKMDIKELIESVEGSLSKKLKKEIGSISDVRNHIIYRIIMR